MKSTVEKQLNYIVLGGTLVGFGLGSYFLYKGIMGFDNLLDAQIKIHQENVIGDEKPETYVEINGVKYYSHVDGKDISDLVKK